jgi:hypothetical protein
MKKDDFASKYAKEKIFVIIYYRLKLITKNTIHIYHCNKTSYQEIIIISLKYSNSLGPTTHGMFHFY